MSDTTAENRTVTGDRIYLREVTGNDVTDDYVSWMNDREIVQYLESRFHTNTRDDIHAFIDETNKDPDAILLATCIRETGEHIGNIKIGRINRDHKSAEISILIGKKKYWGKGYGSEAIRLVSEYAFKNKGLHKLTAECYANNLGSLHSFKKAGYVQEGVRKKQYRCSDEYVDSYILGLVNPEDT